MPNPVKAKSKAASTSKGAPTNGAASQESLFKSTAFEQSTVAMMTIDRDFNVTYLNEATKKLLRDNAGAFRAIWPNFDPDRVLGACIDIFHKNPAHQRQMLSDPSRLPYRTDISVGDLKFALNVGAVFDAKRNYVGNTLEWDNVTETRMNTGMLAALQRSQAVIEFTLEGKIVTANENFLTTLGYTLEEIRGQHHSMFIDPTYRQSPEYRAFWQKLGRGEFDAGQYKRIGKGGKEVWIEASYNPVLDIQGKPFKVVKFATDITAQKLRAADFEGQLAAIGKAQAVIEFSLDGKILTANENFLKTLGYTLEEIRGKHHSMFVDPTYRQGPEYRMFWEKLGRGEYDSGQYKRIGNGGKEVWIEASYNPIMDMSGKPFKVVKYATDITVRVNEAKILELAVQQTQVAVTAAKNNDLSHRIPVEGKTGEIKVLCEGVNGLLDTMSTMVNKIMSVVDTVAGASTELRATAQSMAATAEETSRQSSAVAAASEEASTNVQTVASAGEELSSSITEIGRQVEQSTKTASRAVDEAKRTNQQVEGLATAASRIGEVVKLISDIAAQTNLLALNATIEAARAGEAGKGFAVVAAEVKSLANQTAKATEEISSKIGEMQSATGESVEAIKMIAKTIEEINQISTAIAAAVEEQSAATQEISRNVQQAAAGTQEVNTNITSVTEGASQTGIAAGQVLSSAEQLSKEAEVLKAEVSKFTTKSSAAKAA